MARGLRSNRDNITTRQIASPATGPAPDSSPATGQIPLANILGAEDLQAIEPLGTTGLLARTAANTWALRQLALGTAFEAIAAITNPEGVAGNPTFELDNQAANEVFAGPASGSPGAPGFRALALADLPDGASGSFTPTFSFTTPGDLSVAYASQVGSYVRIGSLVFIKYEIRFTPTYTTASGDGVFGGLPFVAAAVGGQYGVGLVLNAGATTFPAGTTDAFFQVVASTTTGRMRSQGSGATATNWATAQFPTATERNIQTQMFYIV